MPFWGSSEPEMLVTTTAEVAGRRITAYHGLVSGEAVLGANFFRDLFASVRDVIGGRSGSYEKELKKARDIAIEDMVEEAHGATDGLGLFRSMVGERELAA